MAAFFCACLNLLPQLKLAAPTPPRPLPQWTLVGNTPVESAIASEGLSLLPVPMAGCMISFGGYNGRYHNAVHVYRPGVRGGVLGVGGGGGGGY